MAAFHESGKHRFRQAVLVGRSANVLARAFLHPPPQILREDPQFWRVLRRYVFRSIRARNAFPTSGVVQEALPIMDNLATIQLCGSVRPTWQRAESRCQRHGMSRRSRALPLNPLRRFNSSPEVIRLVVMMYVRFPLSLRDVEDLVFERGIALCHETVRVWVTGSVRCSQRKFGGDE